MDVDMIIRLIISSVLGYATLIIAMWLFCRRKDNKKQLDIPNQNKNELKIEGNNAA